MLKSLKFNTAVQKVFFISDTHAYHKLPDMLRKRGFDAPEENVEWTINRTNEFVSENDILINAGDLFLNATDELAANYLSRIKCNNIYMLWGNHPNPLHKVYKRELENQGHIGIEIYPFRVGKLIFCGNYLQLYINHQPVVVSHFPYYVWDGMKDGAIHVCGHSHGSCEFSHASLNDSKIVDVGWEVFGKPISFEELIEITKDKKIAVRDHHRIE
jgi:calcineurin-like phosphoesterase family protein